MKKVFETVTKCVKDVSEEVKPNMTETSVMNNKAVQNKNDKISEIMNNRGIVATCLMNPLFKITKPELTGQFELVKDPSSNRVIDLLRNKTIPISL